MTSKNPIAIVTLTAALLGFASPSVATWSGGYTHCEPDTPSSECDSPLGDNTYNLLNDGVKQGTDAGVGGAININNVDIVVSSWSDTYTDNDNIVVSADLYKVSDEYGYGVLNQDGEQANQYPNHAIDNDYWGGNNTTDGRYYADFDFVLFSFSEAVTLTGANYGWAQTRSSSQVSVAALNDITRLTSGSNTWSSIAGEALAKNSFDIEECDTGYISPFNFTASAKYWLVGAYNVEFGNITNGQTFNDAFKLAAVGFNKSSPNTPSQVSAPGTLGLFLLSGLAVAMHKRRRT